MYQYRCDRCGAYLDPGERCTCEEDAARERERAERLLVEEKGSNQYTFNWSPERMRV